MNFIISGTTEDEPVTSSLEGELEWVANAKLKDIKIFDDIILGHENIDRHPQ